MSQKFTTYVTVFNKLLWRATVVRCLGKRQEVGADVIEGKLSYPSETGAWQLGEIDIGEYLGKHRGKRLMLIIAPIDEAETFTCGICGFIMNEAGECPRCKIQNEQDARDWQNRDLFNDIRNLSSPEISLHNNWLKNR